ncbi:electron transporter [Bordetella sp. H567]|uniref:RnfH family protein n=1 Tax=Bordetella sp. H567 TaxID=1697043 RepID=UPI00081CFC0D|nr:RnfH family protein [Bordetella sp. H567]AOB31096.1 electron transporter [Bordetella sp. H567]
MGNETPAMTVWVVYARPHQAWRRQVDLPAGATVAQALAASGFTQAFPDVDPWQAGVGVFGRRVQPGHSLSGGDRVEIYRALVFDPMESRRRRAAHRARKSPGARPPRTPKAPR